MRIINLESNASVKFSNWLSGNGATPKNAITPLNKIKIKLGEKSITVAHNKSKTQVDYYYAQINGVWMWSRDEVVAGKYAPYVKPAKVVKEVEEAK